MARIAPELNISSGAIVITALVNQPLSAEIKLD
jgi:hypothetical protein